MGKSTVPNVRNAGSPQEWSADDGELPGEIPHEVWPGWKSSATTRHLREQYGWTWPIYYGAKDTKTLVGLLTAERVKSGATFVRRHVRHTYNDTRQRSEGLHRPHVTTGHWLRENRYSRQ